MIDLNKKIKNNCDDLYNNTEGIFPATNLVAIITIVRLYYLRNKTYSNCY